ncbi:MAG: histidine kinase [Bacteroidetes bacterium HGW-Bacteroidetes-21]|nr:MAG: histidine kinase [Bacteroidetes bacterium HGW-Bacteroidetes-21]
MDKAQKNSRYERVYAQIAGLLDKTPFRISRMATVTAILHHKFDYFFWTGFYLLEEGELLVGPYQGSVACQVLAYKKGVCWAAIQAAKTVVVEDVNKFPDHISCDSRSKSEIVVPLKNSASEVVAVLDIDSKDLNSFDETDALWLEKIVALI